MKDFHDCHRGLEMEAVTLTSTVPGFARGRGAIWWVTVRTPDRSDFCGDPRRLDFVTI